MVDAVGTTHHVKINGQFYLIRPGTYKKRPGPLFGSRFTTGDPDFNNLSFWQHWVQHCWVGGFGAETWMDDAMFDEGVGIDTSQHEVMTLSRDMGPQSSRAGTPNWDLDGQQMTREFIVFADKLWCLSYGNTDGSIPGRLYEHVPAGPSFWVLRKTFTDRVRSMAVFANFLVFGDGGSTMNRMTTATVFSTFNKPAGITDVPYTMKVYRGQLYVGFGRALWRLKSNFTWDGSTAFYNAEGINYFNKSEIHLGMLYLMSQNGHLFRTDGNNTFDIWQFEPGVIVASIRSFDGRLFVSAQESLEGTTAAQSVLYQFTGSAITELKRWGKVGRDIYTGQLRTWGSRLWFGAGNLLGMADGFGIAVYEPREDAYHLFSAMHDTSTFPGGTEGGNWTVDDVFFWKGYFYASVRGSGIFRTKYSFKDVSRFQATYDTTRQGGGTGSTNGGFYLSSDFDAGTPGLLKLWNAITVHLDLPTTSTSAHVDYSVDGGVVWTSLASITKDTSATRYSKVLKFPAGGLRSTRLKYRITLRTTDTTRSPQLRSVSVRYLPIPEPNWQWDFQVILSERQELLDHTREVPNIQTLDATAIANKLAALENAFRTQSLVNFIDVDGAEWTVGGGLGVLIANVVEDLPVPGPASDGVRERVISVTLLEAVEAY